jgi:hypothetical protein
MKHNTAISRKYLKTMLVGNHSYEQQLEIIFMGHTCLKSTQ